MSIHKILLIDDDPDELDIFQGASNFLDPTLEVVQITHPAEPFWYRTCGGADLIFLDINMPQMDGFGWLTAIRGARCTVPIIMYSTSTDPDHIYRSYELGANLYLSKPNKFDTLVRVLDQLLHMDWSIPKAITSGQLKGGSYAAFSLS